MFMLWPITMVACGDDSEGHAHATTCAKETRADTYVQGLEKSGDVFAIRLLEATPGPPEVGINQWSLALYEGDSRVDTATISVRPWMPDHGHGTTPMTHQARRVVGSEATHELGPFDFFMPGFWTITFHVEHQSKSDEIVYGFCLEG
jgi:hypothetical protein